MNYTHGSSPQQINAHKSNATETRKNIGTLPAPERFHVSEPNLPQLVYHFHFVNDGSGRVRIALPNEIKNVRVVYLDSLYIQFPVLLVFPFSLGVKFTKQSDYFYPDIRHGSNMSPDNTIWNHPIFENNALGTGTFVVSDEKMRCLRSYRSAYTFSNIEVTLVDETGAAFPWTEINLDIRCETMDWQ